MNYNIVKVGLRMVREQTIMLPVNKLETAMDAQSVAFQLIGNSPIERLIIIAVDGRNNITGVSQIAQGGMHGCSVRLADILRSVLMMHASGFVLAHNHPSGDPTPSEQDIALTKAIREASSLIDLPLLDHIIVTNDETHFSIID